MKARKIQGLGQAETSLDCPSASFSMGCHVSIQARLNHWLYQLTGDVWERQGHVLTKVS